MIDVREKNNCCGCMACFNRCPKSAITIVEDEKGFKYPKVNKEKCIDCGLCDKACPIKSNRKIGNEPISYACYNKNEKIRMESTSGGIFTLLATAIIKKSGVVFGASFDKDFGVYHTYCENVEDLRKFRGSKYLQSNINDTYRKAKEFLDSDRYVLFTGTPCQIEGFISFLGKKYDRLYLQDIICHGVPSPKIWKIYKKYRSKKAEANLNEISFRSKSVEGWNKYHIFMKFDNNIEYDKKHNDDAYMKAFLSHLSLRESCTDCKFKKKNRLSDITLADFWGVNNIKPELNDEKGTSMVIVNSVKGQELFNEIANEMVFEEVDLEQATKFNPSFTKTSTENLKSDEFFLAVNEDNFEDIVNKMLPREGILIRIKRKLKKIVRNVVKY